MVLPLAELSADVRPQDDLWGHVNERWLDSDPVPPDRARWGLSDQKRARVAEQVREIVAGADPGSDRAEERAVARLVAAYADLERRASAGTAPVADELAEIDGAGDLAALLEVLGRRQREGVTTLAEVSVHPHADDPRRWSAHLFQAGLSLPTPRVHARLADDLEAAAARLVTEAGLDAEAARRAVDLERAVAAASWADPYGDDDLALTNPLGWDELDALAGVALAPYWRGLGVPAGDLPLNICQPSYWRGLGALLRDRPLADWRAWATWQVLRTRAPLLTPRLEELHHDFFVGTLRGQAEPTPRWRRSVELVQDRLGEAVGRLWVERHLDPAVRDATRDLAETLRARLRTNLAACTWLTPATRELAVAKLDRVVLNVGWPETWPLVPELTADDSPVASTRRLASAASERRDELLRGPVDRTQWGPPPFVVNTFFHPLLNQLTVEGASLPPADVLDDPAVLFGQYASIIGHELGHAFDSRGSQRDPDGVAREWWTPQERTAFTARADAVVARVDGHRPRGVEDRGVDGRLVGFEVVAELIGYHLAWASYADATSETERAEVVDGATGAQRFFLAKAYGRRATDRPATARARLESDPHPPFEVFAGLAVHLDAFHEAFGTRPGDGMWLAPEERVRFW